MRWPRIRRPEWFAFGKLEALLVLAFLALLLQVFPSLWFGLLDFLNVRNWGRGAWIALNVLALFVLFAIQFGPNVLAGARRKSPTKHKPPVKSPSPPGADWKSLSEKEQKELFKRMQEARKRRVI